MSDPAEAYLREHNVHSVLEFLCAQLVYAKPEDPRAFLASELRKLQAASANGEPLSGASLSLFGAGDFGVVFGMLDPLGKGTLSARQVHKALGDLGLDQSRVDPTVEQNYNVEAFTKACQAAQ